MINSKAKVYIFIQNALKIGVVNIIFIYIVLIFVEAFLHVYPSIQKPTEAQIAENERSYRDKILTKKLMSRGYLPTFYPVDDIKKDEISARAVKYSYFPIASFPLKTTILCNEGYGMKLQNSDELGFRNPKGVWSKLNGSHSIVVGDSFVHGSCVDQNQTISSQLVLQNSSLFINAGIGSHDFVMYRKVLDEVVFNGGNVKLNLPKNLIIVFYRNDFIPPSQYQDFYRDLRSMLRWPSVSVATSSSVEIPENGKNFFTDLEKYYNKQIEKYISDDKKINNSPPLMILSFPRLFILYNLRTRFKMWRLAASENKKISQQALDLVRYSYEKCRIKCKVIVAYIPNSDYWRPQESGSVKAFSQALENSDYDNKYFRYLDMSQALHPLGKKAYAPEGGHLSPSGYKTVADLIGKYLKK